MSHSFDKMLVKAFEGKTAQELLDATPAALSGVSDADAEALKTAFGIKTIRDFAECRFFHYALAILADSGQPNFDPGPPPVWEDFFAQAPHAHYQSYPTKFRLDFGPVYYRGRLDGSARVIIVGQDPAPNEQLAHRVFVGKSGQRLQGFLKKLGITRSYVMLNTFIYCVYGQFWADLQAISLEAPVLNYRNTFLDWLVKSNPIQAIVAVGAAGHHSVQHWTGHQNLPIVEITHPSARDEAALLTNWNEGITALQQIVEPDDGGQRDVTAYGTTFGPTDVIPIPRFDLPFGIPDWHGDGSHGARDGDKIIKWLAP
ncbi:MAG: uracil-DNA glycosylase [candidate division Zixibacteria bacterium]|nr:uracil-DNA glycosylase [candidate division Zixibacteria bacterium]